jgi:hypothetical protein
VQDQELSVLQSCEYSIINNISPAFPSSPAMARLQHRRFTFEAMNNAPGGKAAYCEFANNGIAGNDRNTGALHFTARPTRRETATVKRHAKTAPWQGRNNHGVARDDTVALGVSYSHGESTRLQMPSMTSRCASAAGNSTRSPTWYKRRCLKVRPP